MLGVYAVGAIFIRSFSLHFPGLVQGYADQKSQLEDEVAGLEEKKESLIIELERAQSRINELVEVQQDMDDRETALERQQQTLEQSIGEEEQGM